MHGYIIKGLLELLDIEERSFLVYKHDYYEYIDSEKGAEIPADELEEIETQMRRRRNELEDCHAELEKILASIADIIRRATPDADPLFDSHDEIIRYTRNLREDFEDLERDHSRYDFTEFDMLTEKLSAFIGECAMKPRNFSLEYQLGDLGKLSSYAGCNEAIEKGETYLEYISTKYEKARIAENLRKGRQRKVSRRKLKGNPRKKITKDMQSRMAETAPISSEYFTKSIKQILFGNYSEDVTLLGTGGQIGLGIAGLDLPMDIRDLSYDLTHFELTKEHISQTAIDLIGLIPVIGAIKYSDEAAELLKAVKKMENNKLLLRIDGYKETVLKHLDELKAQAKKYLEQMGKKVDEAKSGNNETVTSGFKYVHNPSDNPKVLVDAMEDPKAVYGYSPNPESKRIGAYAAYDWTDPENVAKYKARREMYHRKNDNISELVIDMKKRGESLQRIAEAANKQRNLNRLSDYIDDPIGLEKVKKSNLLTYGSEEGMTFEYALKKYGSYEQIIENAMGSNVAMDACCGLYDKYYHLY